MTLILKLDLDMVKMYLHTENEVSRGQGVSEKTETDRQTDMTENITYSHTQVVNISVKCARLAWFRPFNPTQVSHIQEQIDDRETVV